MPAGAAKCYTLWIKGLSIVGDRLSLLDTLGLAVRRPCLALLLLDEGVATLGSLCQGLDALLAASVDVWTGKYGGHCYA